MEGRLEKKRVSNRRKEDTRRTEEGEVDRKEERWRRREKDKEGMKR